MSDNTEGNEHNSSNMAQNNGESLGDKSGEYSEYSEYSEPVLDSGTLSCAGRDLTTISPILADKFASQTKSLDFSFNLLQDLTNLEKFTQLESLILDNNLLDDSITFPQIKSLKTFSINNNKISDLVPFLEKVKVAFPNIRFFSMLKNPACPNHLVGGDDEEYKRYRYHVVYHIGELKFLDSTQVTQFEKTEAKRVGPFLKVAKQSQAEEEKKDEKDSEDPEFPALPQDFAKHGEHRGTFGVSKYVYYGRHSEGNRFIRNSDL